MEIVYRRCCGIDIHKKFLVACLLILSGNGQVQKEIRRFSTMTEDLLACIAWLREARCTAIAMESTGVYWQPPFNLMEDQFEQVMIVNAEHLKRVPGHKTDKKDAEWIAELLQIGLLKPSFIPKRAQRELRHLTRLRTTPHPRTDQIDQPAPKGPGGCESQVDIGAFRCDGADQPPHFGSYPAGRG
jgi:transposase